MFFKTIFRRKKEKELIQRPLPCFCPFKLNLLAENWVAQDCANMDKASIIDFFLIGLFGRQIHQYPFFFFFKIHVYYQARRLDFFVFTRWLVPYMTHNKISCLPFLFVGLLCPRTDLT